MREDSTSDVQNEEFSVVVPEEEDSIQKTISDLPKNIIENKDGPVVVQLGEKGNWRGFEIKRKKILFYVIYVILT